MPETKNYLWNYQELAEILVKKADVHEGYWGIYFEFTLLGANVPTMPDQSIVLPASVVFVQRTGIQRFDKPNNLTVDAAKINPALAALAPAVKQ